MLRAIYVEDLNGVKWYALPLLPMIQPEMQFQRAPWWYSGSAHWPILDELRKHHIYGYIELQPDFSYTTSTGAEIQW